MNDALPSSSELAGRPYPLTLSDAKLKEMGYDILSEHREAIAFAALRKEADVLDVATGPGRMALTLAEAGYHVITGDISDEVVQETRKQLSGIAGAAVEFRVMDAMHLDMPEGHMQSIVTANSMHHMQEPVLVLEEMTRALSKDGKLLIVEFNERGFEVIDQLHQQFLNKRHENGTISSGEIDSFLHSHFEMVGHEVLHINHVWVACGKKPVSGISSPKH